MTHKAPSLFDWSIVGPAIGDSFRKLDPRLMVKNPVMFVTMVGAVLTTAGIFTSPADRGFIAQLARLALVHRAVCQLRRGRGRRPRQGPGRQPCARPARTPSPAACANGREEKVPAPQLQKGDLVVCEAGDMIPADGEVIEGIASVDESAITGESAPVIRESGGDRSAVTGGTRVISDRIVIRVTQEKGQRLPGPHDRDGRRRPAPEDAQRNRADDPAGGADLHLPAGLRDAEAVRHLLRRRLLRAGAGRAAGLPDSDHHRRPAQRHRHQRHRPADPAQRHGHQRPRGRSRRRRGRAAARQDRHDHPGQPHGHGLHPRARHHAGAPGRCRATGLAGGRNARRPLHRGAGQAAVQLARPRGGRTARQVRALHRADAHERRGFLRGRQVPSGRA